MTRRPGAFPGRIAGDPATQAVRARRQQQRRVLRSGSDVGPGLSEDAQGRLRVNQIQRLDPSSPTFLEDLVRELVDKGLMEK